LRVWVAHTVAGFPAQQGSVAGILFEERAEECGASAEHADDDERSFDALIAHVRVPADVVDDLQAVHEAGNDRAGDRGLAEVVELRVAVHGLAVVRESFTEAVAAEVVEPAASEAATQRSSATSGCIRNGTY